MITLATILMYIEVGWICFVSLGMGIFTIFMQRVLTGFFSKQDRTRRKYADMKSNTVSETVFGMKNIKFSAWEKIQKTKAEDSRNKETSLLKKMFTLQGLQMTVVSSVTPICCLICFSIYFFYIEDLDISRVYTTIMYFGFIQTPLMVLSRSILFFSSSMISLKRFNNLIQIEDYVPGNVDNSLEEGRLIIKDGNFSWHDPKYLKMFKELGLKDDPAKKGKDQEEGSEEGGKEVARQQVDLGLEMAPIFLKDINLDAEKGKFISIIGKVGSGKSSLLHAILDNMKTVTGSVRTKGSIAFIPQESFLLNDTLRNNILLGKPFDPEWYQRVIDACQLDADIAMLPGREQTEIGERGINLSGGQRQRIAIARAVYSKSDIYLIDDSLSALDAEVGKKILEGVFMGLLKNSTVVMVTNHLFFLEKTDEVLVMKGGRIAARGDYQKVRVTPEYGEILQKKHKIQAEEEEERSRGSTFSIKYSKHVSIRDAKKKEEDEKAKEEARKKELAKNEELLGAGKLTTTENRQVGIVGWRVYYFYLRLAGCTIFSSLILTFTISTAFQLSINLWAGKWAQKTFPWMTNTDYFHVYIGLIGSFIIMSIIRYHFFALMISRCSYSIFTDVFWNILRRPMSFFDTTPSGVIINRCTDDVEITDYDMPMILVEFLNYSFMMLGSFVLSGLSTPIILVIMLPVFFLLGKYLEKYLRTSTELRRLSRLSRAPILTTISELINGLTTIRIYNYEKNIMEKWRGFHNTSQKIYIHELYARIWILWKCELTLLAVYVGTFSLMVFGKVYRFNSTNDPAVYGMLMTSIFNMGTSFYRLLKCFGDLANNINVIERLKEYIEDQNFVKDFDLPKLPQSRSRSEWPSKGEIQLQDVRVRYRDGLPYVLNGLTFNIFGGHKVGVVGRTGSGKSTLILCLMRILELSEPTGSGRILIDGVDIAKIGLHVLRRNLTIIPQEPYIAEGTLRFNIDPLGLHTEAEIISALEKVEIFRTLKGKQQSGGPAAGGQRRQPKITNKSNLGTNSELAPLNITQQEKRRLLDFAVKLNGKNLSQGQKQLICIARVLVAKPKILLMDEATSSIDQKSDSIVQRVIKNDMEGTTVISIAHRLITIIQYDQLVVLKNGVKVEQGSPLTLIENQGYFCSLVDEGGKEYKKKMIYCAKNREVDPSTVV